MSPVAFPRVSVLLPVRDGEPYLDQALRSLSEQSLTAVEVLVVNDGSTDATPELLERWAGIDPRIRVLHQPPRGIVDALERARSAARAPVLARMDADDIAHPRRLALQLAALREDPTLGACGCGVEYFPRNRVQGGARRYEAWLNSLRTPEAVERNLFVECPLAHPSFLLRAEAVEEVGGYRDMGWPEDYDLLFRLWEAGYRLTNVPDILLKWREGGGRLSRTAPEYAPEAFRKIKLHFLTRTLLTGRSGLVIWGAGPTGKSFASEALAQDVPLVAFVDVDPRKVGQEIYGVPVLSPQQALEDPNPLLVGAVGQPGAREEIRRWIREAGREEGRDFVAVA